MLVRNFHALRVIEMPGRRFPLSCWTPVRELIISESTGGYARRADARFNFSIDHFQALLTSAIDHFASCSTAAFDFIKASRALHPVSTTIHSHITSFLESIHPTHHLDFACPAIAAALVHDAYPPGMHCRL